MSEFTLTAESNWGAEPWRAPDILETDRLLFDECGRILDKTDFRSHYFRVVAAQFGGAYLLVKHGGGQERIRMDYNHNRIERLFAGIVGSDDRYRMLYVVYRAHSDAIREAAQNTARIYQQAFIDGSLKKRKQRGGDRVKVWIDASRIPATSVEV